MVDLDAACDAALQDAVTGDRPIPGVVAAVTDRAGDLYTGTAGARRIGGAPMTADTVFAIHSCTKAITGTAVLQCVEDGLLDLDAPAKDYVPDISTLEVLTGFDAGGAPVCRPPARDVSTRHLMLHTAGFGYAFFNEAYRRLFADPDRPNIETARPEALMTPLLFDPGEAWEYGSGIDWAGRVVEAVRGARLGDVLGDRVLGPLGMADTGFTRTEAMRRRTATAHRRGPDGGLKPMDGYALPDDPEVHMGGQGLYATVPDYTRFIRMWLNDGAGPEGPVLRPETVAWASRNGLSAHQRVKPLPGVIPAIAKDAKFFPGVPKGWAYTFLVNEADAPTGRSAGALGWAGLANCYFWIDPLKGVGGFWATQLFPFFDPAAVAGFTAFETAAYDALR